MGTFRFDAKRTLFYIARHGRTGLNADDLLRGPINAPLNADGLKDAEKVADFFLKKPLASIVSSNLVRASEVAMTVGRHKDLVPHLTGGLRSWNIGYIAGLPEEPNEKVIQHYIDNPHIPIPGGESLNQFRQRVRPFFKQAIHAFQHLKTPSLIVAHDSVVREAGTVFNKDMESALVKPGGVVAIQYTPEGFRSLPIFKADLSIKSQHEDE